MTGSVTRSPRCARCGAIVSSSRVTRRVGAMRDTFSIGTWRTLWPLALSMIRGSRPRLTTTFLSIARLFTTRVPLRIVRVSRSGTMQERTRRAVKFPAETKTNGPAGSMKPADAPILQRGDTGAQPM